jgi:ABC-type arginine transport system permease subunit
MISIPLGLLGARNLAPHPVVYLAARRVMDLLRAVNEFVFALMFVTAVGLGPFAGMLALGLHTGGVLGKLLSETVESIDPGQVEGGVAELHLLSPPAVRVRYPIGQRHRHGGWWRYRLLSLGHHPLLQRP